MLETISTEKREAAAIRAELFIAGEGEVLAHQSVESKRIAAPASVLIGSEKAQIARQKLRKRPISEIAQAFCAWENHDRIASLAGVKPDDLRCWLASPGFYKAVHDEYRKELERRFHKFKKRLKGRPPAKYQLHIRPFPPYYGTGLTLDIDHVERPRRVGERGPDKQKRRSYPRKSGGLYAKGITRHDRLFLWYLQRLSAGTEFNFVTLRQAAEHCRMPWERVEWLASQPAAAEATRKRKRHLALQPWGEAGAAKHRTSGREEGARKVWLKKRPRRLLKDPQARREVIPKELPEAPCAGKSATGQLSGLADKSSSRPGRHEVIRSEAFRRLTFL